MAQGNTTGASQPACGRLAKVFTLGAALLLFGTQTTLAQQANTQPVDGLRAIVQVTVPDLIVVGQTPPPQIAINVPDLTIVGKAPPQKIDILVPDLTIIGRPEPTSVTVIVPDLFVVGKVKDDAQDQDEDTNTDIGVATTSTTNPNPPQDIATLPSVKTLRKPPCHGDYSAHFGQGVGTAVGVVMPVGKTLQVPARVDALGCGAALLVTIQGQPVNMTAGDVPGHYTGPVNMGRDAKRTLFLQCDDDLNLRGQLVASDANLTIKRPVWMLRSEASDPPPTCE